MRSVYLEKKGGRGSRVFMIDADSSSLIEKCLGLEGGLDLFIQTSMGLIAILGDQLKASMKTGNTERRDTIRLLQSALKNTAIDLRKPATELSDEEVQSVIRRLVKQRKDSAEQYRAGNREDLALNEEKENAILSEFLPAEMPDQELRALVSEALSEFGAISRKDMGKAMGAAMKKVSGRASGDAVKNIVMELLPEA